MANEEFVEKLLKERYCIHNDNDGDERVGDIWDNICGRVANYLGDTDDEVNVFHDMMYQREFLPNSPTLMNAGTLHPMLSACFFLPISDCISNNEDGIFDQVKNAAIIFKYGGGVGLNFSNLRPAGSTVHSTQGVSSGVISFMKNFNTMTETIKQGGKRRGALLGSLDITHPEIKSFINCKTTEGDLSNFNISVKLTDEFMKNVQSGEDYAACSLFSSIIDGIYKNGEPGILFKDEIERHNPRPDLGELNCNPCTEALLFPAESCNLGSINWSSLYKETPSKPWNDKIDWEKYEYLIRNAVVFLNRVIDKNEYPLPEIDKATKLTRKIGLGGMGFHDLLLKLKIPYDSAQALDTAEHLEQFMKRIALDESTKNNFNNTSLTTIAPTGTISIIADVSSGIEPVFNWVITRKDSLGEHYIVHPIFKQMLEEETKRFDYEHSFPEIDGRGCYDPEQLESEIIKHCHKTGTIQDIINLSHEFRDLFKNAMDISWVQHIKMQSVFQTNGVDMSISKTINLPNNATKDDIKNAISMAWKMKCKGITIYRSGSRENEVLNLGKEKSVTTESLKESFDNAAIRRINEAYANDFKHKDLGGLERATQAMDLPIPELPKKQHIQKKDPESTKFKRPRHLYGVTYKIQSGCGKLYVTINERNSKPYEVFIQSGGSGGCEAGNQALGRTISFALRTGGDIRDIIKQLTKVKCPAALRNPKSEGKSCSDIVGHLLKESIPDYDEDDDNDGDDDDLLKKMYEDDLIKDNPLGFGECPECHEKTLVRESGCNICHSCGYNKCG
jgi:ribonucleoside-diphosphate reductase alpha chain